MLGLLNFFRTRSVLQLFEIGAGVIQRALGLFIRRAELLIFEADENLTFFHSVAFFYADPFQPSRDLGVHVDGMVRDDVAGGCENRRARVIRGRGLRSGANHFNLRHVRRKCAVGEGDQAEYNHDRKADQNVSLGPGRRFAARLAALRAVDAQAL
jgi:hypothetical protein